MSSDESVNDRISHVLLHCPGLQPSHDLHHLSEIRPVKSPRLYLDMLGSRLCFGHGDQGIRRSSEADLRGEQPVYASEHLCVHDCGDIVHFHPDELLQQSSGHVLNECVRIS